MKLAVLFPGIGYTCERPLLYYAGKAAREAGWTVLPVAYGGFPPNVRGDREKLLRCVELAYAQAEARLAEVDWRSAEAVAFIGKSIGTWVGARYAKTRGLSVRHVLLTPLRETLDWVEGEAIAFHGTADPWAEDAPLEAACRVRSVPLIQTEGANHSLETGSVEADLKILRATVERLKAFLEAV